MKNLRLIAMVIFSIMLVVVVYAQHPPKRDGKHKIEWMKKELSLTDEQASKVEAIHVKYDGKMKELHEQMKALREEQMKEVSQVLTKEQNEKLDAKRAEMKEKRKQHHKGKKECGSKCDSGKEENKTK